MSRPTCRTPSSTPSISGTGLSPTMAALSRAFPYRRRYIVQALPISLATTFGISVDFCSSGYLDVSVRPVRLASLWIQLAIPLRVGFPIRTSADQSSIASSPQLIAGFHVLLRL